MSACNKMAELYKLELCDQNTRTFILKRLKMFFPLVYGSIVWPLEGEVLHCNKMAA